jgi:signal transduction histidine kinase
VTCPDLSKDYQPTSSFYQTLVHWFACNSLAPEWLPPRWRQPVLGYVLAVTLTFFALGLELWAMQFFPNVEIAGGLFLFLLILFLGFNWGAGPCLVATILGTILLFYLVYPPRFAIRWKDVIDMLQGGLVLFGGLFVSIAASQRERQRRAADQRANAAQEAQRQAEAIAASLAEAQAISEREHTRLRAVLETLLAMVTALVQPEASAQLSAEGDGPAEDVVSRQLAALTCHVLGSQQVRLFSLEQQTGAPTLLAVVNRAEECALVDTALVDQHDARVAWLDDGSLVRLRAGEIIQVVQPQPTLSGGALANKGRPFLVAPIRRKSVLLGLLTLDIPFPAAPEPGDTLALVQAIAKLGALLIEREHLLRERETARAEAQELSAVKRRLEAFLGIVSHELRTPLTSILLGLESGQRSLDRAATRPLREGMYPLAPVQQRLGVVYKQSKRLERLVAELLESSLIEANQLTLRCKAFDLVAFVQRAVEEQRQLTADRAIEVHLLNEQPLMVYADAERLGLVVSNYLSNALKYSAEEQPVAVGVQTEGQQARVWVQDAGPGIPAVFHAALWERFYRVPGIDILSGSAVGLGLGLYISRKIIGLHNGQVGVESVPGQGARFWFTLPLLDHTLPQGRGDW